MPTLAESDNNNKPIGPKYTILGDPPTLVHIHTSENHDLNLSIMRLNHY